MNLIPNELICEILKASDLKVIFKLITSSKRILDIFEKNKNKIVKIELERYYRIIPRLACFYIKVNKKKVIPNKILGVFLRRVELLSISCI